MFEKILITNRGDQPYSGAAAKLHRLAREAYARDFTAENQHV